MNKLFNKVKRYISKLMLGSSSNIEANSSPPEYNPSEYWKTRHEKYGTDLRGVGVCNISQEENEEMYRQAKVIFLDYCRSHEINFENAHALEIGCGTGRYTGIFNEAGGTDYTGVDITDTLFDGLREKFSDFRFCMLDITKQQLQDNYDLIIMIDVTQHIVDDDDFYAAMENIRSHLNQGGTFIVTAWLTDERIMRTYYEVSRPLTYYKKAFPGCKFTEPVDFRWKYLFSIKK